MPTAHSSPSPPLLEAVLLGVLVVIPLWFTDVLPKQQLLTFLEAPPPPPPPPAAPAATAVRVVKVTSDIANGQLRTPSRIPAKVQVIKKEGSCLMMRITVQENGRLTRFSTLNHNLAYCYDDLRVIKFVWTRPVKNRLKGRARSFDE